MKKLILSLTLSEPTEKGLNRLLATTHEIPSDKLLSPGVRSGLKANLDQFLNSAANKPLLEKEGTVQPRELHSKELKAIAEMVESGKRSIETTIFDEPDHQLLYIKIRKP